MSDCWVFTRSSCSVVSVENRGGQTCVTAPLSTIKSFLLSCCSACATVDVLALLIATMLSNGTVVDDACSVVNTCC